MRVVGGTVQHSAAQPQYITVQYGGAEEHGALPAPQAEGRYADLLLLHSRHSPTTSRLFQHESYHSTI